MHGRRQTLGLAIENDSSHACRMRSTHWYVCFSGAESWPPGVSLKYVGGDQFGHVNMVMVRALDPQEMADVSVQMHSPVAPGMYQGQWRMCTATGLFYGGKDSKATLQQLCATL